MHAHGYEGRTRSEKGFVVDMLWRGGISIGKICLVMDRVN